MADSPPVLQGPTNLSTVRFSRNCSIGLRFSLYFSVLSVLSFGITSRKARLLTQRTQRKDERRRATSRAPARLDNTESIPASRKAPSPPPASSQIKSCSPYPPAEQMTAQSPRQPQQAPNHRPAILQPFRPESPPPPDFRVGPAANKA